MQGQDLHTHASMAAVPQPHNLSEAFEGGVAVMAAGTDDSARGRAADTTGEVRLEGWEGHPQMVGVSQAGGWEGHSQTGGASPMDGWDDMDPMAILSQSAQLPSVAQTSTQCESLSGQLPSSPPGVGSGHMTHAAGSDDNSQAVQSHPVSVGPSQTPSSIATLAPLQPLPSSLPQADSSMIEHGHVIAQHTNQSSKHGDCGRLQTDGSNLVINCISAVPALTADNRWSDFERHLGPGCQAIIHSRGNASPFGPTTAHGYPGVVFEVTQAGHVATVTMFKPLF